MAKRKRARAKRAGKAPTTKAACEKRNGRWVNFPGGRKVCFLHEKASAATKRKRMAALRKARKASPIGKKTRRRRKSRRSRR